MNLKCFIIYYTPIYDNICVLNILYLLDTYLIFGISDLFIYFPRV